MTRRELREKTFILLFRADFHETDEIPEQIELYFDTQGVELEGKDREYVENKVNNIISRIPKIDEAIGNVSEGWELSRIDKVSLTIMRLAYYEMEYDETIPVKVAINEAVELAKIFGQEESSSFVNAILGKLAK